MKSKKVFFLLYVICVFISISIYNSIDIKKYSEKKHTNPIASFEGVADDDTTNVMVPIPMKDRVYNKTGIQCVWASIECIGRYAEERKLKWLTNDSECQGYSSPSVTASKLKKINVKFEQTTSKANRSLIQKAVVKENRGVLFGIPGHAMVMVHYDEKAGIIKYINNSDKELKIRTWSIDEFNKRWDGWICAIYADNDIVLNKGLVFKIRIIDMMENSFIIPKNYILLPN